MSQFNVNQNHPLINRQQTYVLDRKLVTIHSEDRDIAKWPNSNTFEIQLPQDLLNVQSLRLVESNFPVNYSTFTNDYQNTKFQFSVIATKRPIIENGNPQLDQYIYDTINANNPYTLEIQPGFYNPIEMANEIQGKMNDEITFLLKYNLPPSLKDSQEILKYDHFKSIFDSVGKVLYIGNDMDDFTLNFNVRMSYDLPSCEQPDMWTHYTKWGLPYYLGFKKEKYDDQNEVRETSIGVVFNYDNTIWCKPNELSVLSNIQNNISSEGTSYYVKAPFPVGMFGESVMYMKLDKYNSIDALTPYINSFVTSNTNTPYKIKQNGIVNDSFAKIPLTDVPLSQIFDSRNAFLQNVSQYFPPLERVSKLKFQFCYHDGRLVDFGNSNFNFTIAFNMLRDEMARDYVVRVPEDYRL